MSQQALVCGHPGNPGVPRVCLPGPRTLGD
jgi:hypothetical protein